ncbi:MAG: hypothetical protein AABY46_08315 [Nitrospirota bacterium]
MKEEIEKDDLVLNKKERDILTHEPLVLEEQVHGLLVYPTEGTPYFREGIKWFGTGAPVKTFMPGESVTVIEFDSEKFVIVSRKNDTERFRCQARKLLRSMKGR